MPAEAFCSNLLSEIREISDILCLTFQLDQPLLLLRQQHEQRDIYFLHNRWDQQVRRRA